MSKRLHHQLVLTLDPGLPDSRDHIPKICLLHTNWSKLSGGLSKFLNQWRCSAKEQGGRGSLQRNQRKRRQSYVCDLDSVKVYLDSWRLRREMGMGMGMSLG